MFVCLYYFHNQFLPLGFFQNVLLFVQRTLLVSVNRTTLRQCSQLAICDVKYIKPLNYKHLKIVRSLQILSTYQQKGIQRNKNPFKDITSKKHWVQRIVGSLNFSSLQLCKDFFFQQKEKKNPIERSRNQSRMEKKGKKENLLHQSLEALEDCVSCSTVSQLPLEAVHKRRRQLGRDQKWIKIADVY